MISMNVMIAMYLIFKEYDSQRAVPRLVARCESTNVASVLNLSAMWWMQAQEEALSLVRTMPWL